MIAPVPDHGLGRRPDPDPRDTRFLMRAYLPERIVRPPLRVWSIFSRPLDQGDTGTCVGHGGKHWMLTSPVRQTLPQGPPTAYDLYRAALPLDVWPENDNGDLSFGTSVRALAQALQGMGYISEYNWAFDADTAADWLATQGPVVIGINWYYSMFVTDDKGFVRVPANTPLAGGHCVCLLGWSEKRGAARAINSWGAGWGDKGRFWIEGELLDRLLHEDGEAMTAAETRLKK